jgi:DNA segregation ATPase FtsK/SpoIIIE, S-DNA-T family
MPAIPSNAQAQNLPPYTGRWERTLSAAQDAEPAPDAASSVLRDAGLLVAALIWLACVLSLLTHSLDDAAWSTSGVQRSAQIAKASTTAPSVATPPSAVSSKAAGATQPIAQSAAPVMEASPRSATRNWLGTPGAWFADMAYFLLGFGIWWLIFAAARSWLALLADQIRRRELAQAPGMASQEAIGRTGASQRFGWWIALAGLMCAHAVLEWSRLHSLDTKLPGRSGGVLGDLLGPIAQKAVGEPWAALLAVVLLVMCAATVLRFSWGALAQRLGERIDGWFERRREQRELALDAAAGAAAVQERALRAGVGRVDPTGLSVESLATASSALPVTSALAPSAVQASTGSEASSQARVATAASEADFILPWEDQPPAPAARIDPALHGLAPQALPPQIAAASAPLPPSQRVVRERQQGLFADIPETKLPQISLLDPPPAWQETISGETLEMTCRLIEKKLKDFGVSVHVVAASPGPVITRYEIEPATGVKGSQIVNLAKDLARSLSLVSIRVIETIPGKNYMALELPNAKRQTIRLSEILGSEAYNSAKSALSLGLGKDIVGKPVVVDLAKMPHCLVAGTTGSGKSVGINSMILSLVYKAEAKDVRLLLIDPKMLEMSVYEGIPHLLAPVVTDMSKAGNGLNWCVNEMERRYRLMSKMGVRNLAGFNTKIDEAKARGETIPNPFSLTPEEPEPLERLPTIVVVIDELADLMMVVGKKIEELIARLAQKARAAGIHLVLATQRPSVDVITGLIKANVPTRLSFQVSSKIDSRTILDQMGAEALLGMGDMLYLPVGQGLPTRVHGAFVSDDEVHRVVAYLKTQGEPNYIEGVLEGGTVDDDAPGGMGPGTAGGAEADSLYDRAVDVVIKNNKASISLVQRHLGIGYNKAANLLEAMEKAGLVSPMNARGAREILVPQREV